MGLVKSHESSHGYGNGQCLRSGIWSREPTELGWESSLCLVSTLILRCCLGVGIRQFLEQSSMEVLEIDYGSHSSSSPHLSQVPKSLPISFFLIRDSFSQASIGANGKLAITLHWRPFSFSAVLFPSPQKISG